MLLPCEDNVLRNLTLDRFAHRVNQYSYLPRDIETALCDVIEGEIELQRQLEDGKRDLAARPDFSCMAAYRAIDKYNDRAITHETLNIFLKSQGHPTRYEEI